MESNPIRDQKSIGSPGLTQFIRKSLLVYVIVAVALPIFCIILGWRTLDDIATGYIYGFLCLVLFGTLTLFGNSVPAQLANLSLSKYSPPSAHKRTEIDESAAGNRGKELFLTSLLCGVLLFITGLILGMF